jgi:hypothetical protein
MSSTILLPPRAQLCNRPCSNKHTHTVTKSFKLLQTGDINTLAPAENTKTTRGTDLSYTTTDTSDLWCPSRKRDHSSYADREICYNDTTHRYTKEIQETKIRIRKKTKDYWIQKTQATLVTIREIHTSPSRYFPSPYPQKQKRIDFFLNKQWNWNLPNV